MCGFHGAHIDIIYEKNHTQKKMRFHFSLFFFSFCEPKTIMLHSDDFPKKMDSNQDSSSTLKLEGYKDEIVIIASDISLGGKS